jgi:membrane-bound metal-dependent hydrolase YbcI (DUF457 family)
MFAGHFGLAAAVKAKRPETPLWALMAATQLLDILFVPLLLSGVETIDQSGGAGYGKAVIHADYTHSLAGALVIALLAGWLAGRRWGLKSGGAIGGMVFSHWLLNLIVHRADMPVLPGNWGGLPLLGLGVWKSPGTSMLLESLLVAAGILLYAGSLRQKAGKAPSRGRGIWRLRLAGGAMGVLLAGSLLSDVLGIG